MVKYFSKKRFGQNKPYSFLDIIIILCFLIIFLFTIFTQMGILVFQKTLTLDSGRVLYVSPFKIETESFFISKYRNSILLSFDNDLFSDSSALVTSTEKYVFTGSAYYPEINKVYSNKNAFEDNCLKFESRKTVININSVKQTYRITCDYLTYEILLKKLFKQKEAQNSIEFLYASYLLLIKNQQNIMKINHIDSRYALSTLGRSIFYVPNKIINELFSADFYSLETYLLSEKNIIGKNKLISIVANNNQIIMDIENH